MIDIAIEAAKQAGRIIQDQFNAPHTVTYKDANNIVSETDLIAEKAILEILKREFPDHSFFSEEAGLSQSDSEYLWVIDPLDGTSNFTHHLPACCTCISLCKNNTPILGVIYDSIHDELFTGEEGKGAYLNGTKIQVSATQSLEKAITLMGRGASPESKRRHGNIYTNIIEHTRTTRIMGSTALSIVYVASGRFDILVNNDCNFYDYAAGIIIASEAGALVSDFRGNPLIHKVGGANDILVTTLPLQAELVRLLGKT